MSAGKSLVDPNLVYFNGIDAATGNYAVPPTTIDALIQRVVVQPESQAAKVAHIDTPRSFSAPSGIDLWNVPQVGWGIIFATDASQEVRDALAPLIEHRHRQVGDLLQVLDYRPGEDVRGWYTRHGIAAGGFDPTSMPYYLLLIGPPTGIPYEFQYLLNVEYAVGRLAFDSAEEYGRYASSTIAYESAAKVDNTKEIVYWGTQHLGDPATNMSASLLIDPLANGVPTAKGRVKQPVHARMDCATKLYSGEDALRDNLLGVFHAARAPSLLFTASHGMSLKMGQAKQATDNGGLLCQDWAGFGGVKRTDYVTGADIDDDANLGGMIAFFFACFGAGTPDVDQFLLDLAQAGKAPPLTAQPFVAALPRRLLAHPRRSVLAVIGHVDRAWGFSIVPFKMTGSQILPFYESLCHMLSGKPVGFAVSQMFGGVYAVRSAALLSALSPTVPASLKLSDRDLVSLWLERNDSQNYVVLGDPAVRLRPEAMA